MKNPSQKNAFTLVEVIIGITVLSIVMFSITVLTITSIRANEANIHKLTAYYLAQESIEGVRNMRDSNWLQNHGWNQGMRFWDADFNQEGYYTLDYRPVHAGDEPPWKMRYLGAGIPDEADTELYRVTEDMTGNVFYVHEGTTFSDAKPWFYHRYLHVVPDPNMSMMQVTAYVEWTEHGRDREVVVSTEFSDWREGPI